ncbi:MAG: histidine phosphatase family protein [Firmicutes bacterium]|nr:histidine phosphatase family protein [Bacillota bacterium]
MRIGYNREKTEEYDARFGAVILAAGLSLRMKDFKPLLPVDGRPAIEGLVETIKAAGLTDITVVTGHNRGALAETLLHLGVSEAYNGDYESGMFSSIQVGLAKARTSGKEGYLLMPVDCPLISVSVMRAVMDGVLAAEESEAERDAFAVALFEGKKGHPLYIPEERIEEILQSDGQGGLAAITDKYADDMIRVETGEEGCLLDMDTPAGYEDIKKFVAKGFAREKLDLLTARKRIILVRHGETRQHEEPIFIGQYDVPLSDEGRAQAEELGKRIAALMAEDVEAELLGMDKFGKEPMPAIERIYSSDLTRAVETADIIAAEINRTYPHLAEVLGGPVKVKHDAGLREISLGDWDGHPIREIADQYPEEYERRGRDIFSFKMRGAESFYDMQYRVKNALRNILRNDDAKDIIIVAHSGVIRALENNILGKQVSDDWDPVPKGELRMLEPFPEQSREKVHGDRPMNMNDLTMEAVYEMYE